MRDKCVFLNKHSTYDKRMGIEQEEKKTKKRCKCFDLLVIFGIEGNDCTLEESPSSRNVGWFSSPPRQRQIQKIQKQDGEIKRQMLVTWAASIKAWPD